MSKSFSLRPDKADPLGEKVPREENRKLLLPLLVNRNNDQTTCLLPVFRECRSSLYMLFGWWFSLCEPPWAQDSWFCWFSCRCANNWKETLLKRQPHIKPHTLIVGYFNILLSSMDKTSRHKLNGDVMKLTTMKQMDLKDSYKIPQQK